MVKRPCDNDNDEMLMMIPVLMHENEQFSFSFSYSFPNISLNATSDVVRDVNFEAIFVAD